MIKTVKIRKKEDNILFGLVYYIKGVERMQSWMISEISILVITGILALLFQWFFGWRALGTMGGNGALTFFYGIVFPSLFLIISLINGMIYHFSRVEPKIDVFFVVSVVIPMIALVSIITYAAMRIMKNKKEYEEEEKRKLDARNICKEWVDQFSFVDENTVRITSANIRNNIVYGHIMLEVDSEEEREIVYNTKNSLPGKVQCLCTVKGTVV